MLVKKNVLLLLFIFLFLVSSTLGTYKYMGKVQMLPHHSVLSSKGWRDDVEKQALWTLVVTMAADARNLQSIPILCCSVSGSHRG